jgi:hypothetical protein
MVAGKSSKPARTGQPFVALLLLLVLAPYILIYGSYYLLWGSILRLAIWLTWSGRDVLLVYSDSPTWKDYMEREIIPPIHDRAVILNWSDRQNWKSSVAVLAFMHFMNDRNFNPAALVFRPWHSVKRFRFYKAFKDFKHGSPAELERVSRELFDTLGIR